MHCDFAASAPLLDLFFRRGTEEKQEIFRAGESNIKEALHFLFTQAFVGLLHLRFAIFLVQRGENFIKAAATNKALKAGWIVGGYLSDWVGKTAFPKGFNVNSPKDVEAAYRQNGYADKDFQHTESGKLSFTQKWLEGKGLTK